MPRRGFGKAPRRQSRVLPRRLSDLAVLGVAGRYPGTPCSQPLGIGALQSPALGHRLVQRIDRIHGLQAEASRRHQPANAGIKSEAFPLVLRPLSRGFPGLDQPGVLEVAEELRAHGEEEHGQAATPLSRVSDHVRSPGCLAGARTSRNRQRRPRASRCPS